MSAFFPRQTVQWKLEEPPAFRRLSLNVWEMAIIAGVALRLVRAIWLSQGDLGTVSTFAYFATIAAIYLGLLTAHVGNYTIRQWPWRVLLFAAVEIAAEALVSLGLIALGREPYGSALATYADWWPLVIGGFWWRVTAAAVFALVLAAIVTGVRAAFFRHDEVEAMDREADAEIAHVTGEHVGEDRP